MPKKKARGLKNSVRRPGRRLGHSTKISALVPHTPIISNRDQISDRALHVLGDELDEAAIRAVKAGAVGDLTYQGAGATGIVFCDEQKTAFKVARQGREESLAEEALWLMRAALVPGVREHVARNTRYDKRRNVLIRGLAVRFILGAVLDAHERGVLTPAQTPELWAYVEELLAWCSMPGDETA
jgi:hypothetical protein